MSRQIGLVFWTTLALGICFATFVYRSAQTNSGCSVGGSYDPAVLSEKDKVYIDRFTDSSKWLETIAYGTLVGVVVTGLKNRSILISKAVNFGSALLIVSVYSSFLSQDAVLLALSKGPVCLLYSNMTRWLVVCQVWSLIVAFESLALWFLKGRHSISLAGFALLLLAVPDAHASPSAEPTPKPQEQNVAQAAAPDSVSVKKSCIVDWVKSQYGVTPTEDEIATMTSLALSVGKKAQVPPSLFQTCAFVASSLDQVRWAAYNVGSGDYKLFVKYANGVNSDISASHWSQGAFLSSLLAAAELWRARSGLIIVSSKTPGSIVSIDDSQVGLTTYVYRASCGTHTVTVRNGMHNLLKQEVNIVDGQEVDLHADSQ